MSQYNEDANTDAPPDHQALNYQHKNALAKITCYSNVAMD